MHTGELVESTEHRFLRVAGLCVVLGLELCEENDAALRFSLRPGAVAWKVWLARFLQVGLGGGS
jgi:hypothetical protein